MSSILNRASRNFLWRHPWQLALSLLGVTLGVAVVIAIDLALESSLQSFEQAGKAISGTASYRIIAGDGGLDERIYNLLRVQQGIRNLSPVLQTRVTLPQHLQTSFKLVGIDPYIEKSFQSSWQKTLGPANSQTVARLVSEPNTALLSIKTASQLNLKINDSLTISTNLGERQLRIIGVINPSNAIAEQALHNTIISDIATTQELTGLYGKLSFIDVMPSGLSQKKLAVIGKTLPGNVQIVALETQAQSIRRMTEAFSINLTALSLLSLLIGMFLIYNTMTFLVVQRRKLIGILRLLGVTRRQIFFLILKEAFFLGIIGTSAGILLG
ncbi:MAG: ABC transporter permease, partial [Gammaproteobacteria bacterium]